MDYAKFKEEVSMGFYSQLLMAKKHGYTVSINAVGFKNLTGKVISVKKYAVMLNRGDGVITTISMPSIRMITIYTDKGDESHEE